MSKSDTHPIRAARLRRKMTQAAVGEAIGVTKATVCKWEQGQALPEPAIAMDLGKLLKLSLEDVYASARAG